MPLQGTRSIVTDRRWVLKNLVVPTLQSMLIVSNAGLPKRWIASSGESGESILAQTAREFLGCRHQADTVWVVNGDAGLALELAAVCALAPAMTKPLVCVDIVLRRPRHLLGKVALPAKRWLLRNVGHYIHHFRDLRGYDAVFGIGPTRSSFVPFKPNLRYRHDIELDCEGTYVLCFGRSMRDFDTFFDETGSSSCLIRQRSPVPTSLSWPHMVRSLPVA